MMGFIPLIIVFVWEAESDSNDYAYHTGLGYTKAKDRKDAHPSSAFRRLMAWWHPGGRLGPEREKEKSRTWLE